ncbi:mechanosensitive ion channel family protein [Tropicibacter naphthalenivorans]|uniref:Small-conductance mechanosensitive channel n=1 Tax=Tropicibacter naphthalenivorans TaxID=441103 RepID=A0A0P1GAN2_9RHOB|nr:mechanosensitive ion channel family protein [Tropicibacter naphthalenivorans]CUH78438.1 Small-conductance mechanosensitive channel [Tropicibacter naphthalenivorans]SMC80412.1 small conductance mechanosensitive channel [Tropicibacter naphthalenivorans]
MEQLTQLMNTEIYNGKSLSDLLTLEFLAQILGNVVAAIVILLVGWMIANWTRRRIQTLGENHARFDTTLFHFLGNAARYVVLAFTALFVLNTFGVQTTSIVAAIGAAGLAVGLALQGTLSNVAAGVMIVVFRPIKIGDFVEVAGEMGTVKDITLNTTELASLSNVQVIIPNAQVWGNVIENYSVYPTRRAEWTFGVGYGANLKTAEETIRQTIMADPRSLSEPAPFIQVNGLGDSSVDFLVRVWVESADYFQYQADMKRAVKEALDAAGVDIPFPTRTLVMDDGDAPSPSDPNPKTDNRGLDGDEEAA